ncbi:uncharacterized protein LOC119090478 isoform X2 [Pollicipes pollicipes]|nr:uncharacterized protein LOC119089762 [Pollicipes pollicipes]XP_037069188.1 uncharacterized protein LOC119090478 isoform X2 [Pollicipes pollicipes]XP_037069190.1 uncharacterized protein LOC119090478 isoform X2 [Pollicipes pollicipes]
MSQRHQLADLMFGPAGAELPVISNITYNVETTHASTEVPRLTGTELDVKVSLVGKDVIGSLKELYRSGVVTQPYPLHVQKMASLGKSEVTVRPHGARRPTRNGAGTSSSE